MHVACNLKLDFFKLNYVCNNMFPNACVNKVQATHYIYRPPWFEIIFCLDWFFFLVKSISDFFHHTPSSDSEKQHPIPAPFMYIIKNSLWYWVVSPAKTGIWSGTNSLTWSMTASKAAAKALATFASFPTSTASPDLHLLSAEESQLYIRS